MAETQEPGLGLLIGRLGRALQEKLSGHDWAARATGRAVVAGGHRPAPIRLVSSSSDCRR
ncbi:hypothetical protein GCM10023191_013290 [Actinoallomurus oryzae]|uniref:Uncharacterized protein n=1 Tax=Actinoallomurus oryzae TaxID=502180 RepID=A0ABP8PIG2_9ACTN